MPSEPIMLCFVLEFSFRLFRELRSRVQESLRKNSKLGNLKSNFNSSGNITNSLLIHNATSDDFYDSAMTNVWLFGGIGIIVLIVNFVQVCQYRVQLSPFTTNVFSVHVLPILLHTNHIENETALYSIHPSSKCWMV